jgi:hypothetical protein
VGPGDFVIFAEQVPSDGFYEPHVGVRTGMNAGKMQVWWSDDPTFPMADCPGTASTANGSCHTEAVGPQVDLFSTKPGYMDITFPYTFPFIIGLNYFRFSVTTKTHGGTGTGYRLFLDYFNLKFLRSNG